MSVWPEERLREEVRSQGGRTEFDLPALMEVFGVRRLGEVSRRDIDERLAEVGLAVDPPLSANGHRERVTLRLIEDVPEPPAGVEPEPEVAFQPQVAPEPEIPPVPEVPPEEDVPVPLKRAWEVPGWSPPRSRRTPPRAHVPARARTVPAPVRRPRPPASRRSRKPPPSEREPSTLWPELKLRWHELRLRWLDLRLRQAQSRLARQEAAAADPVPAPVVVGAATRKLRAYTIGIVVLGVVGGLLVLEGALTVLWQEPFSALKARGDQSRLERQLRQREREAMERTTASRSADLRRLALVRDRTSRQQQRVFLFARALSVAIPTGNAVGKIKIPQIDVEKVVVQGTDDRTIRKGPGHYKQTLMPGQGGTVGIAGHRTTYGAPFRKIDNLKKGHRIVVTMPYGRFTYRVDRHKIFKSSAQSDAFRSTGHEQLVLSACHPVFSDAERIVVFARLVNVQPLGAARDPGTGSASQPLNLAVQLGSRDLARGNEGQDVKVLQRLLGLPTEGAFGPRTEAAVRNLQTVHGIPATGVVGPKTRALLLRLGSRARLDADPARGVPATPPEPPPPPQPRQRPGASSGQGYGSGQGQGSGSGQRYGSGRGRSG